MELIVQRRKLLPFSTILCELLHLLENDLQLPEILLRELVYGGSDNRSLQDPSDEIGVLYLLCGQGRNELSTLWNRNYQPVLDEHLQGFADRSAAYGKPRGEMHLIDLVPGVEFAVEDGLFDIFRYLGTVGFNAGHFLPIEKFIDCGAVPL